MISLVIQISTNLSLSNILYSKKIKWRRKDLH